MNEIKAVVLDLGGVVIKLNWFYTYQIFTNNKNSNTSKDEVMKLVYSLSDWKPLHMYERGEMSCEEFHKAIVDKTKFKMDFDTFKKGWNGLLEYVYPELEILLKKVQEVPLYALSNTNKLHYDEFKNYTIVRNFKQIYVSHEMGMRKPEKRIYNTLLENINMRPENTLFVDDTFVNLESAKETGIISEQSIDSVTNLEAIFKKYKVIK